MLKVIVNWVLLVFVICPLVAAAILVALNIFFHATGYFDAISHLR